MHFPCLSVQKMKIVNFREAVIEELLENDDNAIQESEIL